MINCRSQSHAGLSPMVFRELTSEKSVSDQPVVHLPAATAPEGRRSPLLAPKPACMPSRVAQEAQPCPTAKNERAGQGNICDLCACTRE